MGQEILFNELDKYVSADLSDKPTKDKWQKVSYEANGIKGIMLFAPDFSNPKAIEIDLKVNGIYKIYLCLGNVTGNSSIEISLSDDSGKTCLNPTFLENVNGYGRWQYYEYAEEGYYKTADLTGKKIIINKPYKTDFDNYSERFSSCLLYIRLEKPTDEELQEFLHPMSKKTIAYHFDTDYFAECEYKKVSDYLGRLNMFENGKGETLVHEIEDYAIEPSDYDTDNFYTLAQRHNYEARRFFFKNKDAVYKGIYDRAKSMGMTVLGGVRMNIGDFTTPYNFAKKHFTEKYPEYSATLRNGEKADFLSYAFPEARSIMIEYILQCLPSYFDGVSLFFHRGGFALFDKPVIDDVQRLYGVDARRLPFADERLHGVLCSYMTQFMRELKAALNERAKKENRKPYIINVIVWFDIESSKNFGYDVEAWAKEGLIDSVSQGLMTYYEDLSGVLADDGLIDLDKYKEKEKKYVLVKRYFGDAKEYVVDNVKDFLKIKEKYGVEFYAAMPWESRPYEYYLERAEQLYAAGATKLLVWNANHTARRMPAIETCKIAGDAEKMRERDINSYRKTLKVNKLGETIKVEFDTNWKG